METTTIYDQFDDNFFEGNVTFITKDFIYVGEISDSKFHGSGMIQFNNGIRYTGNFYLGNYHGKGELYEKDPIEVCYYGYFENGKMNGGFRIEYFTDNSVEVCKYEHGIKEGDFILINKESIIDGCYKEGKIFGDLFIKTKDKEIVYTMLNGNLIQKNKCHYLVIDTKTTGIYSSIVKPRLVQLSYIGYNYFKEKIVEGNFKIKPDGFEIPSSAYKIHGISSEDARINGIELFSVLEKFQQILENTELIIGHNIDDDILILVDEYKRMQLETSLKKIKSKCIESYGREYLNELKVRNFGDCSDEDNSDEDLEVPISLLKLYNLLFNKNFDNTSNAYNNVKAIFECYEAINDGFKSIQESDEESDLDYFANIRF